MRQSTQRTYNSNVIPLPPIGDREIRTLYTLVEDEGLEVVASWIGVSNVTLLRVLARLGHRCRPAQMQKVKRFFAEVR